MFKFYIKYENWTCHWVVHSKMKTTDIEEFFRRKALNDRTYTEEQVTENQAGYLNEKSTQKDKDVTVNVEEQTEDSSVNPEKKY